MSRDIDVIRLCPDVFEINSDVAGGDGNEGKTSRVREIEFESAGEFRAKVRLAESVVNKTNPARLGLEMSPQEVAKHTLRDNETLLIALESKSRAPDTFVRREGRIEASASFWRNV